ncbi:MAG: DegT/DnrJ/EryC1/StrS family aminotransferase [Gemmatimonadales bacterium]|nr:DegT/DnrJ/EryC1/StrS family aminotransferase [Gemmatimonadales bacterium]
MRVPLLDLVAQHEQIQDHVIPAIMQAVARQSFIMGPEVGQLEQQIAELSGVKHAIACASGTDALLLSLKVLDLAPGDEVITPAFTFFATAGAIHNAGGTPVFVDIERSSFNVCPAAIEAAITPRTRAIVAVHLFGQMAAMEQILPLADRHGLAVIEDAAQAIGAARRLDGTWHRAGSLGTTGTFSFFPSKNLGGWGDGGMVATSDDALAERLRRLRLHGGGREYHHDEVGYNSRLDTVQAAVLLAKLPFLAEWSAARRQVAGRYTEALSQHPEICPPLVDADNEHIFHQYTLRVPRRDALQAHLRDATIGHKVYYPMGLHLQPCFQHLGYARGQLPVTEEATAEVISLPVYPELSAEQQQAVIDAVTGFYG